MGNKAVDVGALAGRLFEWFVPAGFIGGVWSLKDPDFYANRFRYLNRILMVTVPSLLLSLLFAHHGLVVLSWCLIVPAGLTGLALGVWLGLVLGHRG